MQLRAAHPKNSALSNENAIRKPVIRTGRSARNCSREAGVIPIYNIYIYIYIHMHTCVCIHQLITYILHVLYTYIHMCVYIYICIIYTHMYAHVSLSLSIYIYIYIHISLSLYIYIYIYIYICITWNCSREAGVIRIRMLVLFSGRVPLDPQRPTPSPPMCIPSPDESARRLPLRGEACRFLKP